MIRPGIRGETVLRGALALLPLLAPALGHAQDAAPVLDTGDTAWMLTSTVLVLFMTIPGLALFYAGMVRSKNVLSRADAVLRRHRADHHPVGDLRLQPGVRHDGHGRGRGQPALVLRWPGQGLHVHHQPRDAHRDDPGVGVRDLPAHVRDHHPGADRRRLRRAHEVLRDAAVHRALVHVRLPADGAHGVERRRRADVGLGRARLRRRHGRAHQRGHRGSGRLPRARQAQGLSARRRCRRTTSRST